MINQSHFRMLFFLIVLWCLAEVSCQTPAKPPFPRNDDVRHVFPEEESVVPGEYLIKLKGNIMSNEETKAFQNTLATEYGVRVKKEFAFGSLNILYVEANDTAMETVSTLSQVDLYSRNYRYTATDDVMGCNNWPNPYTWGMDRIDQRHRLQDEALSPNTTYTYGYSDAGQDVNVYIVDSGVDIDHPEFENRASWGYTAVGMDGDSDLNGHGTHVAGTVGSKNYGVAKKSTLIAVKVLDVNGRGSTIGIIDGMRWVYIDHVQKLLTSGRRIKSVSNLSLGGKYYDAVYTAVINEIVEQGIVVVVAAGNDNENACLHMPASVPAAITVGASDVDDKTTYFSNWGECVDIFAPGQKILSTWPRTLNATGVKIIQGTSMAAPHVAGVVARYMSMHSEAKSPKEVTDWLLNSATNNALQFFSADHASSPNKLLFMSCDPSASSAIPSMGPFNDLKMAVMMMMMVGITLYGLM